MRKELFFHLEKTQSFMVLGRCLKHRVSGHVPTQERVVGIDRCQVERNETW